MRSTREVLDPPSARATVRSRFTVPELADLLGVSAARVRRWVRLGLITPVDGRCFDFSQVSLANRLCRLIEDGASLTAIRRGLERARRWMPDEASPVSRLASSVARGRLLWRIKEQLVDATGQRHFDFSDPPPSQPCIRSAELFDDVLTVDELFERALALEDADRLDEAAAMYRRAIRLAPDDAALHFNLGNVLQDQSRMPESAASYQAALRFDPEFVEAWNNLGLIHLHTERLPEAVRCFRRALDLVPDYAAARWNLNLALERLTAGERRGVSPT